MERGQPRSRQARMTTLRRILHALGSPRLGITLLVAFAIYAALASLPLFPARWLDPSTATETTRITFRHLPFIDRSEGEYFAWWPSVTLLIAVVINMTISMLTRVAWSWRKTPVLLTHGGVLLLALGSAIYAAQKQEGEILLLAPEAGEEVGPPVSEMLDKARTAVQLVVRGDDQPIQRELVRWPRFHARTPPPQPIREESLPSDELSLLNFSGLWSIRAAGYRPPPSPGTSEGRSGATVLLQRISPANKLLATTEVPFSRHAAEFVVLDPNTPVIQAAFTPLRIPTPGISLALQSLTINLIPGTDLARNVTAQVRTNNPDSPTQTISLNQPLTLPALAPPTCDCLIRGTLERLWHQYINPVHWKFSIAGWDQEGWLMSREAAIAGLTDKPHANFVLLAVGTTPGTRIVAAGAILLAAGAAWALLVSTFRGPPGARVRVPAYPAPSQSEHRGTAKTPHPGTKPDSHSSIAPSLQSPPAKRSHDGCQTLQCLVIASVKSLSPMKWANESHIYKAPARVQNLLIKTLLTLLLTLTLSPPTKAAQTTLDPTSPLRTLPVQWNGRTAPLDTVARDIIRAVSNRSAIPQQENASPNEDPLTTLLGLVLDPDTAASRPLISTSGVRTSDHTPLPKLISINEAKSLLESAHTSATDQAETQRNLAPVAERLSLATLTVRSLAMVAPPRTSNNAATDLTKDDWLDAESPLAPPPISAALESLRAAWREGDPRTTTIAANRFADILRAHNENRYDRWRVWMEAFVNSLSPLKWSAWLYALAAALGLWAFIRSAAAAQITPDDLNDPPDRTLAEHAHRLVFALAWLVHAAGFACRWIIAGRIPIQNQYESMIGLSLAACTAAGLFALFAPRRNRSAPAVLLAANTISLIVLGASNSLSIPGNAVEPEAAILGTASLLKYHVVTVLVAYSFIAVGGMIAAAWLITRAARPRREDLHAPLGAAIPVLIRLSFWTLAVGILLGALWADRSWGRWWAFDPKETWALITWMVYLIALHIGAGRHQTKDATPSLALLSLLGTLVMLWSWFGVNLLLPGLHAYAGN
jgi:ABC-type transport system involved in cytochrome c biogenesis permease subunit